jgi:hypothetical protein
MTANPHQEEATTEEEIAGGEAALRWQEEATILAFQPFWILVVGGEADLNSKVEQKK